MIQLGAATLYTGDCLAVLKTLPEQSVQTCITSPPYFGLRDYGVAGQLGLEASPEQFIERMVEVFREVRRVLRDDATLWLNMGDTYATSGGPGWQGKNGQRADRRFTGTRNSVAMREQARTAFIGYKPKDLMGMPWMLAFALRADGWYLRQDIIWCLSGGAWVYARTQKGDMPVMVKDLVRLDPATVRLWNGEKWTRVLGWGASTDASERLEVTLRSGERIGCTGGHLWPTLRGNVAARELTVGDIIRTCRLPAPCDAERPGHLTDESLWLAGLYLAEGSRNGSARQISLCADEARWIPRIEAVARHYGGNCTHKLSGNNLSVRLYGRVLHAVIDAYVGGATSIDIHLTNAAWRLPNASLLHVISGYLEGDGHYDAKNNRWRLGFCRNYSLERDLRTAAARLGAKITLSPRTASYQSGEVPVFRGEWRWESSGHWNEKDRGEVIDIRASRARSFWDIAVEDEPHLFALASGVLTHNCKPNPMPESVRDRCTKAHEYIFLLSKSERYYLDQEGITEPCESGPSDLRKMAESLPRIAGKHKELNDPLSAASSTTNVGQKRAVGGRRSGNKERKPASARGVPVDTDGKSSGAVAGSVPWEGFVRNKRSVWTVATQPFTGAHFATFPPDLIRPCIMAGAPPGGVVLDPFSGSGTTGMVALEEGRAYIGIELNPEYQAMAVERITPVAAQSRLFA